MTINELGIDRSTGLDMPSLFSNVFLRKHSSFLATTENLIPSLKPDPDTWSFFADQSNMCKIDLAFDCADLIDVVIRHCMYITCDAIYMCMCVGVLYVCIRRVYVS